MEQALWIGVDMGGTNIRVGLMDGAGTILGEEKVSTEADKGPDYVVGKLSAVIDSVKGKHIIQGIGIGMPGPLDSGRECVMSPVNLPGWENLPLKKLLRDRFSVPCFIENDCNVAALAEAVAGAGKDASVVFYITVSTGIGGGLCVNKKVYAGATGNAGEIANVIVREHGVRHSFLNPGSMEGAASGTSIVRMAHQQGLDIVNADEVFRLSEEGDPRAVAITEYAIDSLARGMAAIAHVVDPEVFVLGGGVSMAVPDFTEKVAERFESYIYGVMRGHVAVRRAELKDPGMLGAMYMVRSKLEG